VNDQQSLSDEQLQPMVVQLEQFFFNWSAVDWFTEQADHPELMQQRGLRPAEPLPKTFTLFDSRGVLNEQQQRKHWLELRAWADDFDAIVDFTFPAGLADGEYNSLHEQFKTLQTQGWSPQAALDAVLADWPEDKPERACSPAASEARLLTACEAFLKKYGT
jgi:predicted nucleic acid-binding Zn ribbon protein